MGAIELVPVRSRMFRKLAYRECFRETGKDLPFLIINRSCGNLVLGRKSRQNLARVLRIIESECRGTVGPDDLPENANVYGESAPKGHSLIDNQGRPHQKERKTASQQDDHH